MSYQKTIDFLFSQLPMYHRVGASAYKADLNNTIELLALIGDPQHSFRSIHVAGTNGKGSVSHMLASILQECGMRVGLYTSPHLRDFRERIRVNGQMISRHKVVKFVHDHQESFQQIKPSFFEMTVAMAFDHFREEKTDICVIEVGMGGRLDSTNVLTPLLSVITNISFDHMAFLGHTLELIAAEKAGIIKEGIPVVIGETAAETKPIFLHHAQTRNSPIIFADDRFASQISARLSVKEELLVLDISRDKEPYLKGLLTPFAATYQQKNIITVLACCEQLSALGIPIDREVAAKGILNVVRNTGLMGRWQVLSHSPLTICDTGHNTAGLREVLAQIRETKHRQLHFVFGLVNDKETEPILEMLPQDAVYYFCKADIPRGLDAHDLKSLAMNHGLHGKSYPSVKEAYLCARKAADPEDLVFVGGSTFVVAEVI
jgi:dihydrofolate synthase / folylpolyglutamate synthase